MKTKKIVCLILALLVTGCSNSLSLSNKKVDMSMNESTTTTTTKTTAKKITTEKKNTIVNTIWEYIGTNGHYKYIYFKKDNTGVDDFAYYVYDTSARYKTSACHFHGYGNIINETKDIFEFRLDNGEILSLRWLGASSFTMNKTNYSKVDINKLTLVECK